MRPISSILTTFHGREIILTEQGSVIDTARLRSSSPALIAALAAIATIGLFALVFGYGNAIAARVEYYTANILEAAFPSPSENAAWSAVYNGYFRRTPVPVLLPLTEIIPIPSEEPSLAQPSAIPPKARAAASVATSQERAIPKPTPSAQMIGELFIEKLGIRAPVLLPAIMDTKSINKALESGIILWPRGDRPGGDSAIVLLGHSSAPLSYRGKYAKVFAMLEKLEPGDIITITAPGRIYAYAIEGLLTLDPKKDSEEQLFAGNEEMLLLVSCWPVGTNWNRIVVRAERVQ